MGASCTIAMNLADEGPGTSGEFKVAKEVTTQDDEDLQLLADVQKARRVVRAAKLLQIAQQEKQEAQRREDEAAQRLASIIQSI